MESQDLNRDERPDEELLEAFRAGEAGVYGELYSRYRNFAIMIARKYREGSEEAQDLVSEAFAKILDALTEGKGPRTHFRAYLAQTVKNVAFSGPRRTVAVGIREEIPVAAQDSAEETVLQQETAATAMRAYNDLPERWRSVLWMLDVEGLRPREVAQELGMTPNAVSALALRAREALRENYLHQYSALEPLADCSSFDAQIPALVRGRLSPRKAEKVQKHLDSCVRCSSKALSLMSVERTMHIWIAPVILGMVPLWSSMTRGAALMGGATAAEGSGSAATNGALVLGNGLGLSAPSMSAGVLLTTAGLMAAGAVLPVGPADRSSAEASHSFLGSALQPLLPETETALADEPTRTQQRDAARLASAPGAQVLPAMSTAAAPRTTALPAVGTQPLARTSPAQASGASTVPESQEQVQAPAAAADQGGAGAPAGGRPSAEQSPVVPAPGAAAPARPAPQQALTVARSAAAAEGSLDGGQAPAANPASGTAATDPGSWNVNTSWNVAWGDQAEDEVPAAQEPAAQEPAAQEPAAQAPAAQDPAAQDPVAEDPAAQDPVAQDPAAQDPVAGDPAAQDPAAQDPAAQEPVADDATDPVVDEPVDDAAAAVDDPVLDPVDEGAYEPVDQGAEAPVDQGAEAPVDQGAEAPVDDAAGIDAGVEDTDDPVATDDGLATDDAADLDPVPYYPVEFAP